MKQWFSGISVENLDYIFGSFLQSGRKKTSDKGSFQLSVENNFSFSLLSLYCAVIG